MIRVLVLADVCLYREGLALGLRKYVDQLVTESVATVSEAVDVIARNRPDVLLVDVSSPGAPSLIRHCIENDGPKVIALAINETTEQVLKCAEAGVSSYFPREGSFAELISTIENAERGELYCSPRIAGMLFRRVSAMSTPQRPWVMRSLTRREREIAVLLSEGCSNKEIARRLRIHVSTVKNHVHHVLEKLQVSGRGIAAALLREVDVRTGGDPTAVSPDP